MKRLEGIACLLLVAVTASAGNPEFEKGGKPSPAAAAPPAAPAAAAPLTTGQWAPEEARPKRGEDEKKPVAKPKLTPWWLSTDLPKGIAQRDVFQIVSIDPPAAPEGALIELRFQNGPT